MMEALREWISGLTAVAALLFLVRTALPKGVAGRVAEFVGSLLLILALLRPLEGLEITWALPEFREEIEARQAELEEYRREVIDQSIREYTSTMEAVETG